MRYMYQPLHTHIHTMYMYALIHVSIRTHDAVVQIVLHADRIIYHWITCTVFSRVSAHLRVSAHPPFFGSRIYALYIQMACLCKRPPQFFGRQLQAPMSTCSREYGTCNVHVSICNVHLCTCNVHVCTCTSVPSFVDKGVWLYSHHRGDEILRIVSPRSDLDQPVQCATDEHQSTLRANMKDHTLSQQLTCFITFYHLEKQLKEAETMY